MPQHTTKSPSEPSPNTATLPTPATLFTSVVLSTDVTVAQSVTALAINILHTATHPVVFLVNV